ncbi:SDR family NAD(P)-dependent oxidoreductase [Pseudomonas sp. VS40]|uniref:SDR family NAD(P)-dependent oxidoreductase n=1 Tax=unclassified Pseudomonas TaxID=196821 RepID=UPI001BDE705D|nr:MULTISPECIES: SDR family NAD(P)-dependent oxidoreductase [unclassified Pseudomonas]MBT1263735.1 SDR family NAD(P)-dependent oxidoreductase [Pseudomonas sp. VS40]MBT1275533.1 SDR family NAD(P)-dependent oxidoreductase [Pseudomonas sp. VS59]
MAESVVWIAGVGAVAGLGAALARRFAREDYRVAVSGRSQDKLQTVVADIEANGGKANAIVADLGIEADVLAAIAQVNELGTLRAAIFNVGNSVSKPALELSAELFEQTWRASTLGGFLFAREATRTLLANGGGSLLFTGATASLRGKPPYTAFAAGKAGLRSVSQSFAREFGPRNVHVAHVVIDGSIDGERVKSRAPDYLTKLGEDGALRLEDIADAYWYLHTQPHSAWTQELDLRPFKEPF